MAEETAAALKEIARRTAQSQARLIRDVLRDFTRTQNLPPLPAGLGMFNSGHTDTAGRRKELLRQAASAQDPGTNSALSESVINRP